MPIKSISKTVEIKAERFVDALEEAERNSLIGKGRELEKAIEEFRDELFKALKIPQIADWLNKQITKIS